VVRQTEVSERMMRAALFCVFLCVVAQGAILPFLKTPKHDGIKRVCTLTAENFTAVVTAADTAVIVVSQGASKSACPSELDTFAEVTAQVLRKKNSIVCQTTPDVLNAGKTLDLSALASPGDILIYKKGRGFPYYGKRSTRALLNHLFKVNGTQVSVISGKVEKKAFDAVDQVKAVGFFMQGTPDYLAYVEVAARLSPSIAFYIVLDRTVAMHMRFSAVGEIQLFRPPNKVPTTCPYNPATAVDIEGFLRAGRGAVLSKITEQNMYDPSIIDPTKILVLAIGDGSTPMGGFFYRLITRVIRTNFNNTLFDKLNIVWIEPEMFPTIHLMMDELESTLGIPKRLPALGALNITTLQSSWFNTATLNISGAKPADIQNSLLVQDFLNGVITNTLAPVKIGGQSFVQLPSSQTVHEHSTVLLECVIENPVGDCLWLKDGRNIGYNLDRYPHYNWRGDRISGDCSLVITGATIGRDNGEWICEMTGDDLNPTLTSPPVKLLIMTRYKEMKWVTM